MKHKYLVSVGMGVLALMLLTGTAFASAVSTPSVSTSHKGIMLSDQQINTIASEFGIDAVKLKEEVVTGTKFKDILKQNNITMAQLKAVFGNRTPTSQMISAFASKFNLDPTQIQTELQSGKTLKDILKEHNITAQQIRIALDKGKK